MLRGARCLLTNRPSPVKFDLNREPDALKTLTDLALAEGTLIVWTSPTTHTCTVAHVASACNLSFEEAEVLVNRGSERVEEGGNRTVDGGSKFDLLLPNVPELAGLNVKLGLYFNPGGNYANPEVVKIGNTKLTDHLMRLGMRPTPRVSTEEKDDETGGV